MDDQEIEQNQPPIPRGCIVCVCVAVLLMIGGGVYIVHATNQEVALAQARKEKARPLLMRRQELEDRIGELEAETSAAKLKGLSDPAAEAELSALWLEFKNVKDELEPLIYPNRKRDSGKKK